MGENMGNNEEITAISDQSQQKVSAGARKRAAARIISELCTGCGICVTSCPTNCITIVKSDLNFNGIASVDQRCTGCNICAIDCPWVAVDLVYPDGSRKSPAEYAKQLQRLRGYK